MTREATSSSGLTRRQLILGGAGAALVVGIGAAFTGPGQTVLDALPFVGDRQPLDRTPMSERVGERFTTHTGDGERVVLTLSEVGDLSSTSSADNFEGQFVARFRGPANATLNQDTYRFGTESFGDVDIFVVPGAIEEHGADYSAVFNRMVTEVVAP
jgi:hypothetical protein